MNKCYGYKASTGTKVFRWIRSPLKISEKHLKSLEEIWGLKWALYENMPTINFVSWTSRTNRISIQWINHNGWVDIFVIKENHFFSSYFRHISLCFYSKSEQESSLDAEFNSASNEYPHCILLTDLATPKTRNTWKNVMMMPSSHFFRYFLFLG